MRSTLARFAALLVLALPALAQSQLVVVLKNGQRQAFNLAEVARIEFPGGPAITYGDPPPVAGGSVLGEWEWVDGQTLVVHADHRIEVFDRAMRRINEGRWEPLEGSRRFRFTHQQGGYIDTVTLSASGNELDGSNNHGYPIHGRRKRTAAPPPPPPPPPPPAPSITGIFGWVGGQTLVLHGNQTFQVFEGARPINDGRWELLDANARRYRFTHRLGGWVDTVTLSPDGRTLSGTNNHGLGVSGTRK
jgi:hypothetical protein